MKYCDLRVIEEFGAASNIVTGGFFIGESVNVSSSGAGIDIRSKEFLNTLVGNKLGFSCCLRFDGDAAGATIGGLNVILPALPFGGWSTLDGVEETEDAVGGFESDPANAAGEGNGEEPKRSRKSSWPAAEVGVICADAMTGVSTR